MGQRLGGKPGDCPVTEDLSDRVLRLPFYNDLSEAEQGYVVEAWPRSTADALRGLPPPPFAIE
jgi:dTDP-4-amino-4,6-dideoxygalactose transaminase